MVIDKKQHKNQLTVGDVERMINAFKAAYGADAKNIPVYLGDDEELNGVHEAYCIDDIPEYKDCKDNEVYFRELIEENGSNRKLLSDEVALLIS